MHLHQGIRKHCQRLIRPFNSGTIKKCVVCRNSVNVTPFESSVPLSGKGFHVDDSFERDWNARSANATSVRETGTNR